MAHCVFKAALESLKRRNGNGNGNGDTQSATATQQTKIPNECSPISSQMSALLFSSSPSVLLSRKQAKIDEKADEEEFSCDDDLGELLVRELEGPVVPGGVTVDNNVDIFDGNTSIFNDNSMEIIDIEGNTGVRVLDSTASPDSTSKLDSACKSPQLSSQLLLKSQEFTFSAVDSIYNMIDERGLPMIDFNTPQYNVMSQNIPEIVLPQTREYSQGSQYSQNIVKRFMVTGCFNIDDLKFNIRAIGSKLHMNPINAIKQSNEKRVTFLLALMLRDFRQIGSNAQLRLIDGSGNEIIGTMPFSACEKEMKLTYGLILLLNNVTVFKAPAGGPFKYLNITKNNIQGYYNNIKVID